MLGILGRTIGRAVPQVFVFFLISFVIFLAFAQCFFMAYYASVEGYQSYQASIMSVLRFTVLDFDYDALSRVRPILPRRIVSRSIRQALALVIDGRSCPSTQNSSELFYPSIMQGVCMPQPFNAMAHPWRCKCELRVGVRVRVGCACRRTGC